MNEFNNASEEDSFLRNLRMLSFNKQIEDTFNLICGMCEKPFFTCFSSNDVCSDCNPNTEDCEPCVCNYNDNADYVTGLSSIAPLRTSRE